MGANAAARFTRLAAAAANTTQVTKGILDLCSEEGRAARSLALDRRLHLCLPMDNCANRNQVKPFPTTWLSAIRSLSFHDIPECGRHFPIIQSIFLTTAISLVCGMRNFVRGGGVR